MDKKAPPPAQTFPISLQQWQNDYSKRPTQQQLTDLTNEKNQELNYQSTNLLARITAAEQELNKEKT